MILDYGAGDGRRFWLLGLEGDRHWPNVLRAVDRPDLADDPRFAGLFDREGVWWAPVQATHEFIDDEQAIAATPWSPGAAVPETGQHTEEVLLELGYDWDTIMSLKDAGAIT